MSASLDDQLTGIFADHTEPGAPDPVPRWAREKRHPSGRARQVIETRQQTSPITWSGTAPLIVGDHGGEYSRLLACSPQSMTTGRHLPGHPLPKEEETPMATDYDEPRKNDDELSENSIEELKNTRTDTQSAVVDLDEAEAAEGFELPGADLSGEELMVRVLPAQADEFTCASCFLVRHRSQVARQKNGQVYCTDCEG
jgi:hypothetical protein